MNFRAAIRFVGRLVLLLGAAQLLPLLCALLYGEPAAVSGFAISAAIAVVAGALMMFAAKGDGELYRREGILIVAGGWILASIFGALPYILTGAMTQPVDALFESASGFTTTGASVMIDIEAAGRAVLFWRSFTQWLGGMGIIILFVALLPELGPGARFLYKLEMPGPTAEAFHPRIHDTAAVLWKIYFGFTLVQTILLMFAGMSLYDALTHTFSTLSTGGFSPRNASVAAFQSPAVDIIIIVFMILAGANFSLYYGMKLRGSLRPWRDPEFRLYLEILAVAVVIVGWDLLRSGSYDRPLKAFLDAAFQVVSVTTTTGFVTANFDAWPSLSRMTLVFLMFIGGCAGSTAGSMKVMRMLIGVKSALREARLIFSPNTVLSVFVGGKSVPNAVVRSVSGFFILYLSVWGTGALLLTFGGASLESAGSASAAVLGNIGPGLQTVGPMGNYAGFGAWEKSLLVLLMWLGRLEIYAIAALFTVSFWRP